MNLRISVKWNFIIFSLLVATLTGMVVYYFFPDYIGLVSLFFYIIPSNSFIPFPHEPAIIYYGKMFGPAVTTLTAIIPTLIACIIDYAVLTPVFTRTRLRAMKETGIYKKLILYYGKAPFFTNFFAALSPVPFSPIRILSVSSAYPLWKYSCSVVLGRIPRYYVLALSGTLLNISNWVILIFFLSLISMPLYQRLKRGRRTKYLSESDSMATRNSIQVDEE
jgi:membrane protein YqaA with SNARE-associated domain